MAYAPRTMVVMAIQRGQRLRIIQCCNGIISTTSISARNDGPTMPSEGLKPEHHHEDAGASQQDDQSAGDRPFSGGAGLVRCCHVFVSLTGGVDGG